MNILVIDVGTTSTRGILYNEQGEVLSMKRVRNQVTIKENGWAYEPASDWENNLTVIFTYILSECGPDCIQAVAITAQRSSVIPVDRNGAALMDTIMWQDTRNASVCEELGRENPKIFSLTGSRVNTVYSGSKMTWIRRNCPEIYEKTYKFVTIPEYMIYLMTGEYESDVTYGSRTGLMNLRLKDWDEGLLSMYEVDKEKLCHLNEAGTIVGMTRKEWSEKTGCPAGIPVISAGGDQQCGAIGQGASFPGNLSIVTGTGAYGVAICEGVPDDLRDNVTCNASGVPGRYQLEVNIITCSNAYDWAIRTLTGMEKIDYGKMEEELKKEKDPAVCLVIPYFKGTGAPDWNAKATASFMNVTLATRRSEMLKAVLEGIFLEMADKIDSISGYMDINTIYVSGGMTKSDSVCQMQADIYGREILIKDDAETTAFGAFLTAMVTMGRFKSMGNAQKALNSLTKVRCFRPDPEKHRIYRKKQKRMNRIYEAVKGL